MKNQLRTILLIAVLSALVIGVGTAVTPSLAYVFVALAVAINIGAYFFSDKLALRMHGARELDSAQAPELHAMVAELAMRAGITKPRLYVIADRQPNAFATGRNPEHGVVAVTEGLLDLLSVRELRGVVAHELAHIKNRDILVSSIRWAAARAGAWQTGTRQPSHCDRATSPSHRQHVHRQSAVGWGSGA